MVPDRFTLVSFAPRSRGDGLRERLVRLGFHFNVMPGVDWLDRHAEANAGHTVVYFDQRACPREQFESVLTRTNTRPRLGIFRCDGAAMDGRLLERCADFVTWPCPDHELALRLERACAGTATPHAGSTHPGAAAETLEPELVCASPALLEVIQLSRRIAATRTTVLIQGETGTGKDLLARFIHRFSPRRDHPFVPVNCGTIPDSLAENELFGHESGAFTDARRAAPGLIAQADRGTLFLDEIETLPGKAQVALLRFLQDHEYRPLGGRRLRRVDVRVIAASNVDLAGVAAAGRFRTDLLYRLNIMQITIPPLRDRPEDIPQLAEHFIDRYCALYEHPARRLPAITLDWLLRQPWPGNVRELESFIHRACVLSDADSIAIPAGKTSEGQLPAAEATLPFETDFNRAKVEAISRFERSYLQRLLRQAGGNVTLAARRAGKERRALGKLLKKHGMARLQSGSK